MASLGRMIISKGWKVSLSRHLATAANSNFVNVAVNDKTGVATVSLNRAPVNSLNLELCVELKQTLEKLEKEKCRGVVLTSTLPTIFSAGLDIMEMYKPDIQRASNFWNALQDLWLTIYSYRLPTAAAINGASPAGGCLLAMSCEYRVMVQGKHTIGLNETKLGIVAPKWFQDTMVNTIGHRQAEISLLQGRLLSPDAALKIGLVDEVATDKADAIAKCEEYISAYAKISYTARLQTKLVIRNNALEWLKKNRDSDTQIFLTHLQQPKVQQDLDLYIQSLKRK